MTVGALTPTMSERLHWRNRPDGNPLMYQSRRDLLFFHWKVDPVQVQRTLPPGLTVDTYNDLAYVGIVPFMVCDARPRGLPAVGFVSDFLELNIRTYVVDRTGAPGIWYYALDCDQPPAVWGARMLYSLNYRHAQLKHTIAAPRSISYAHHLQVAERSALLTCAVGHESKAPAQGTLDFFLLERYLLFSVSGEVVHRTQIHHAPYPMVDATMQTCQSNLLAEFGFDVNESVPDHVRASPGVDVEVFALDER